MKAFLTSLIVGSNFVPPAKILLEHLPSGARLKLLPEPENPYDEEAIIVLCPMTSVPESQLSILDEKLPGAGFDLGEMLGAMLDIPLGHVAATGGKPLLTSQFAKAGTKEFLAVINRGHEAEASLAFGPDGKVQVLLSWEEGQS